MPVTKLAVSMATEARPVRTTDGVDHSLAHAVSNNNADRRPRAAARADGLLPGRRRRGARAR